MAVKWPSDFRQLWDILPSSCDSIWSHSVPEESEPSRIRNALELLCGALWHLELAKALGDFSTLGVIEYRESYKKLEKRIPWQTWIEQYNGVNARFISDHLTINYQFNKCPDEVFLTLTQTMLVADATLRLYGSRDVLSRIESLKLQKLPILAPNKEVASWIDKNSTNYIKTATELQKNLIIVIAFRDWYMHGEIPEEHEGWLLRSFRNKNIGSFTLLKIAEACLEVWIELVKLAKPKPK
jgi:hypothetical protein